MRVGIWNQGEYEGYPEEPEQQINWFLDTAEAGQGRRASPPGSPSTTRTGSASGSPTSSAPPSEYRYRYQLKLEEAQGC